MGFFHRLGGHNVFRGLKTMRQIEKEMSGKPQISVKADVSSELSSSSLSPLIGSRFPSLSDSICISLSELLNSNLWLYPYANSSIHDFHSIIDKISHPQLQTNDPVSLFVSCGIPALLGNNKIDFLFLTRIQSHIFLLMT